MFLPQHVSNPESRLQAYIRPKADKKDRVNVGLTVSRQVLEGNNPEDLTDSLSAALKTAGQKPPKKVSLEIAVTDS